MLNTKVRLVILSSGDPKISPSARFRVYQFLPFIEAVETLDIAGAVVINQQLSKTSLIFAVLKLLYLCMVSDVLFVQKTRLPRLFFRIIMLLTTVIYDFDDSNFLPPPSWDPKKDFTLRRDRVIHTLRHSHQVIAGNDYLRHYAQQFNPRVVVIPTVVTTSARFSSDRYQWGVPPQIYVPQPKNGDEAITIGWIGGGEHVPQLEQVLPALIALQNEHGVTVKVVSDSKWTPEGLVVVNKTWVLENEVADVQSFDIGLMPLDAEDPFLKGKCAFKAIEYMAVGIPVVASSVGANRRAIVHDCTGFLVEKPADWKAYLTRLVSDPKLREEMGSNARHWVESHYSLEAVFPKYIDLLKRTVQS